MTPVLSFIPIEGLLPHENIDLFHVRELSNELKRDLVQKTPIIVDINTNVIIDGHHRTAALALLNVKCVGAICLDYLNDSLIQLDFWKPNIKLSKTEVLRAGLQKALLDVKTTKHKLLCQGFENNLGWPLELLSNS